MTATLGTIGRTDYGSRSNTVTPVPSGTANGDLLIFLAITGNNPIVTVTLPAGFTQIGSTQTGNDGTAFSWCAVMGYRIASSEPANYTCTHTTAGCETIMLRIDGTATLSVDVFSQAQSNSSTTSTATSVTPTAADDLLLFLAMNWDEAALAPPTGMTEQQDAQFIYLATQALASSSATGTRTQTHGGAPWIANLIAIKDAGAGGTTLTAEAGSYTLTGTSAGVAGRAILDGGAYTLTGFAATLGGKALASGGSYALTGSAATLTTGYPSALTTGPAAGTSFTPFSGDFSTSSDGEIVEDLNVTGQIIIQHDNVTVRDCIVNCTEAYGISTIGTGLTGAVIERVRVIGIGNQACITPDNMPGCEIRFCDLSNSTNGIFVGDNSQYFHDNYIHDLDSADVDPHVDGIQGSGGFTALTIEHNTIISWDTSCIILQNEGAGFSGVVIDNNLLIIDPALDGAHCILCQDRDDGVGSVSDITVTNNRMLKGTSVGQDYGFFYNVTNLTWGGNVDNVTGLPVNFTDGGGVTTPGDLVAAGGSYTLTGAAATFLTSGNVTLPAAAGNYLLTGFPVMLAGKFTASAGSYLLNGFSATLAGKALADAGGYNLTGFSVTFTLTAGDFTLFCGSGSYALSGSDVSFPGYDPAPPVQPTTGGGYTGGAVYDTYRLRKKRKRDEIEELIDAVLQSPAPATPAVPHPAGSPPPALIDLMPKMQAVGLTPPQRKIVKRAIVTDDPDDDDEAIELLLTLLS